MPGRFDFTGPPTATNRPIYVGDYRSLFVTTDGTVDYSTGWTFLAEIAPDRLPTTAESATFTVTPVDGGLLLELSGEQSTLLGPLIAEAEPDADGNPPTSAFAHWDLQTVETATGRPTTLLSGVVKIEGDVSRA